MSLHLYKRTFAFASLIVLIGILLASSIGFSYRLHSPNRQAMSEGGATQNKTGNSLIADW